MKSGEFAREGRRFSGAVWPVNFNFATDPRALRAPEGFVFPPKSFAPGLRTGCQIPRERASHGANGAAGTFLLADGIILAGRSKTHLMQSSSPYSGLLTDLYELTMAAGYL